MCATAYARDGSLQLAFGLGKYTNRGVIDGYAGVCRGDEQWTVRASRDLTHDVDRCIIGPIRYEILEPMVAVRFSLEPNDVGPVSFEWTFHGSVPAALEDREIHRSLGGSRVDADVTRYHQSGTATGWVEVEGKRHEFDTTRWVSTRDHSWSVRYQVGAPAKDLPRPPRPTGFSSYTIWMPVLLTDADGTVDTFTLIDPQLRFQDDNRRLLGGSIHVRLPDGTARTYVLEVPTATGFHLGTGLYFGFEGKYHGQWRGALDVSGEHVDDCADPTVARRLHQHRDCVVHLRDDSTGTTGWGNAQTIVIGAFPDLGLTAEQSFV